jgi:hypothetical protein
MIINLNLKNSILYIFCFLFCSTIFGQRKTKQDELILFKTSTSCIACYEQICKIINAKNYKLQFQIESETKSNYSYEKASLIKKFPELSDFKFNYFEENKRNNKENWFNSYNIRKTPSLVIIKNSISCYWPYERIFYSTGINDTLINLLK